MAAIWTNSPEISDVVLYEEKKDIGFCRKQATVNVTAAFKIGTVVEDTIGDGTYDGINAAATATLSADVGIVIDDAVYDGVTGDRTITILNMPAGGIAAIKDTGLAFLDALDAAQTLIVTNALAARGMKIYQTV